MTPGSPRLGLLPVQDEPADAPVIATSSTFAARGARSRVDQTSTLIRSTRSPNPPGTSDVTSISAPRSGSFGTLANRRRSRQRRSVRRCDNMTNAVGHLT